MRTHLLLSIVIPLSTVLLHPPIAFANCQVPGIKANGEYFKSDVVFTGTVISQRYRDGEDEAGWFYRVSVGQVFRGAPRKEIIVYTEDASNRFPLEKGSPYLLFARRNHGRLEIDDCGNSALLLKADESLRLVRSIGSATNGEIEGWLVEETWGVDLSGIHVNIRGASQVHSTITDNDGWFRIRLPKGRYKVDFSNGEYYMNGGDIFWYDTQGFTLHTGESAALQLVSVRHPRK